MKAKPILAILVAMLVAASGSAGSFYFAGAQEQAAIAEAEITLDIGGNIFTITSNETRPEGPLSCPDLLCSR